MEQATKESNVDSREEEAKSLVNNHVLGAMGIGLIPIPIADLIALSALQMKMLSSLSNHYDQSFRKDLGKSVISSLLGGVLPIAITPILLSFVKMIPIIGQTAGAVTMPVTNGAITYAIGSVFIQHFELGGTLLDFDAEKVREQVKEEFEKGKEVATELSDKSTSAKSPNGAKKKN